MKSLRITSAVLFCVPVLALAACGQDADDTTTTTAPAPTSAAASAPASPAPASSSPSATSGSAAKGDKALCTTVEKAGQAMKAEAIAALGNGTNPDPADFKKILSGFAKKLTTATANASDSRVTTAAENMRAEAAKAAAEPNPIDAAANPTFEQAGSEVSAACAAAGVKVNF